MTKVALLRCAGLALTVGVALDGARLLAGARVGQPASVAARVVDAGGYPVPGAWITAMLATGGPTRGVTTNSDGFGRFEDLPDGTYRLDFELLGFDIARHNHVAVRRNAEADVNAVLYTTGICDCVRVIGRDDPIVVMKERVGQILDESGHPLPHARLEVVTPSKQEFAYADTDGRFSVKLPVGKPLALRAFDSGFTHMTLDASGSGGDPLIFRLRVNATARVEETERFRRSCCELEFFTSPRR